MFYINIDASDILAMEGLGDAASEELQKAGKQLTEATRAHIIENANEKLHTRRQMYVEALSVVQIDDTTWAVNLDASVRWIEDGQKAHSMIPDLLKSDKAKTAKDGSKYVVVPFQHNKGKAERTPAMDSLLSTVKKELAKIGQKPNKIEMDASGKPKLGLVRSMDITKAPINTGHPKLGAGPVGKVAQGPTGIPLLKNVRVYQHEMKDKDGKNILDSSGNKKIGRTVMTFRIASSKHEGTGRWNMPDQEGVDLFPEAAKWANEQWEKMAPAIVSRIVAKIG